jgi:hypothetical protein
LLQKLYYLAFSRHIYWNYPRHQGELAGLGEAYAKGEEREKHTSILETPRAKDETTLW